MIYTSCCGFDTTAIIPLGARTIPSSRSVLTTRPAFPGGRRSGLPPPERSLPTRGSNGSRRETEALGVAGFSTGAFALAFPGAFADFLAGGFCAVAAGGLVAGAGLLGAGVLGAAFPGAAGLAGCGVFWPACVAAVAALAGDCVLGKP